MITVHVGGVPEHFNLAWHLAIEQGRFLKKGIQIDWVDVPGGTGAMCKQLRDGEIDIAIALTEGVINDIAHGNPSKIVQFYVNSPLRWGIFVAAGSDIYSTDQMAEKKYAISRHKSGSHLMAYVNANSAGLQLNESDFVVVGSLDGARKALKENEAQLFMWEKFTTKPLVDSGEFRQIGECATPWPCFVLAASDKFIKEHSKVLTEICSIINLSCLLLQNNSEAPEMIASRYHLNPTDAAAWFRQLEYAGAETIEQEHMKGIFNRLKALGILDAVPEIEQICYQPHLKMAL